MCRVLTGQRKSKEKVKKDLSKALYLGYLECKNKSAISA